MSFSAKFWESPSRRERVGPFRSWRILLSMGVIGWFVIALSAEALTPFYPEGGDPDGELRLWLKFDTGSGTTAENYANFHVCSNPAYNQSNFTETDGTLNGTTGTPAWVTASSTNMPSLDFTRANKHYVSFADNDGSCTTSNDPFDHDANTDDLFVSAWVNPDSAELTCANLGNKYTIVSKWDGSSQCSYKMYLEAVDSNGGGCINSDMVYRLRALINDSGATFNCTSPQCVVRIGTVNVPADEWNFVSLEMDSDSSNTHAFLGVNNEDNGTSNQHRQCNSGTDLPDPLLINNSTQDVLIGIDTVGGSDAFDGKISDVKILNREATGLASSQEGANLTRMLFLNHFDVDATNDVIPPDGPYGLWGYREAVPQTPPVSSPSPPQYDTTDKRYIASYEFDGVDDQITFINQIVTHDTGYLQTLGSFLIEAWIRPHDADGGGTKDQTIIANWEMNDDASCTTNTAQSAVRMYLDTSGKVNCSIYTNTSMELTVVGNTALQDNKWYHVACFQGSFFGTVYIPYDKLRILLDGTDDSSSAVFSNAYANADRRNLRIGATKVASPGTTCSNGVAADYFDGEIDEPRWQLAPGINYPEVIEPGVAINEVNYKASEEKVELYYFADKGTTLDMDGYTLRACSQGTRQMIFDDACGNCASKVLDPGDRVTIVLTNIGFPTDTSCSGAATTCTWYSSNSAATSDLAGGDLADSDGLTLHNQSGPSADVTKQASMIDAVFWGANQGTCETNASGGGHGIWQVDQFIDVSAISDNTRSIQLHADGLNNKGVLSWRIRADNIGSDNTSTASYVEMLGFNATLVDDTTTLVEWQTGAEFSSFGFHIHRSEDYYSPKIKLNLEPILARGSASSGATYEFTDETAAGESYFYWLEEVQTDGLSEWYGPVESKSVDSSTAQKSAGNQIEPGSSADIDAASTSVDQMPQTSNGCGSVIASEDSAGVNLFIFFVAFMFFSTRTHMLYRRRKLK